MANYPKELTDLVEEYLTDGIISAKERQVLLRKAEQLGIDVDEFDLYIDAQQQKVDQAVDAAASKKRGKTCPFCGGTLPQLTEKCPHCGELVTPEASEELQEIFEYLEDALVDFKSGKDIDKSKAMVERYVRKAKMYYDNNPKVKKLLAEIERESENTKELAFAAAKAEKRMAILKNKWNWVVAEIVIVALCWIIMSPMISNATNKHNDLYALQEAHPDSRKHYPEQKSLEFEQIIADKNKVYEEVNSLEGTRMTILIIGLIAIVFTVNMARKDAREK